MTLDALQTRIVDWAATRDDIRAVMVAGSRARRDHPADSWSDLDLILYSSDVWAYDWPQAWLPELGTVWVTVPELLPDGLPEHLVLFDGGLKVDFSFLPLEKLTAPVQSGILPRMFQRGYHILLDKDSLAAQLPPSPGIEPPTLPPSSEVFLQVVRQFWYGAYKVAIALRRGELWRAKTNDHALKSVLLQLIEWHAQAIHDWQHDTWIEGRFMHEWTDPETWQALFDTFGRFDAASGWHALDATMALFSRLATEVAPRIDCDYPAELERTITEFVAALCHQDSDCDGERERDSDESGSAPRTRPG